MYGDGSVEPTMSDEQRLVHLQQQQFHQQQQQQRSMEAMQHIDQKLSELASTQAAQAADLRKGGESVAEATNNVIDAIIGGRATAALAVCQCDLLRPHQLALPTLFPPKPLPNVLHAVFPHAAALPVLPAVDPLAAVLH